MKTQVKFLKALLSNLGLVLIPAIVAVYFSGMILIRVANDILIDRVTFIPDRNIPINFASQTNFLVYAGLIALAIILVVAKTHKEFEKSI